MSRSAAKGAENVTHNMRTPAAPVRVQDMGIPSFVKAGDGHEKWYHGE
jgi:hypothetical protein